MPGITVCYLKENETKGHLKPFASTLQNTAPPRLRGKKINERNFENPLLLNHGDAKTRSFTMPGITVCYLKENETKGHLKPFASTLQNTAPPRLRGKKINERNFENPLLLNHGDAKTRSFTMPGITVCYLKENETKGHLKPFASTLQNTAPPRLRGEDEKISETQTRRHGVCQCQA